MIDPHKLYAIAITCGAKRGHKDSDLTFSPASLRDFLQAVSGDKTATYTCEVCGVSMQMENSEPKTQPLSDEETKLLWHKSRLCIGPRWMVFKRLIEAEHKI